jgi:hypothetical protein
LINKSTFAPFRGLSLLQARGGEFGDKVYLCANGFRRWVPSVDRLAYTAFYGCRDLIQVPDAVLASFAMGGWLLPLFDDDVRLQDIRSSVTMRE